MMPIRYLIALLPCVVALSLHAGAPREPLQIKWHSDIAAAVEFAKKDKLPVMAVFSDHAGEDVGRLASTLQRLEGWLDIAKLSQGGKGGLAAVKISPQNEEVKELLQKYRIISVRILWLDHNGNLVMRQGRPPQADVVTGIVSTWANMLVSYEAFFKNHLEHGVKCFDKGKLREAYLEFSLLAPFKGPEGDKARDGKRKIVERWESLLGAAQQTAAGSIERLATGKGLRRDIQGTDCVAAIEVKIKGMLAAAQTPATPAPVAKAEPAPPPVEAKTLSEAVAARALIAESPREDAGVEGKSLKGRGERMESAGQLIERALAQFRKATDDKTELGAARNDLLRDAKALFQEALEILDKENTAKPAAETEKLMERVSMLIYGCQKYQSL